MGHPKRRSQTSSAAAAIAASKSSHQKVKNPALSNGPNADPFAEGGTTFSDGQLKSMAENWIDIEDQPMIIEAELEECIERIEALEDAAAGPGDDDSEATRDGD